MKNPNEKRRTVFIVILLIFVAALAVFLLLQYGLFQKEQGVVETVREEVAEEPESGSDDDSGIDEYLLRKIDFDALWALNGDVETWLFIPDTNIDAYVMREPVLNQYKYDKRDIYGNYTTTGSFLIPKSPMDMEDAHTLILGHHMPGNSNAFGNLVSYYRDSSDGHPNVYLYYPDHSERWIVWLVSDVKGDDMLYELPYEYGTEHYRELLDHLEETARYISGERPDLFTEILCLSTCNRWNSSTLGRFVVVCVPDAFYYYNGNEDYGGVKYISYADMHAAQTYDAQHENDYDEFGNPTPFITN